VHSNEALGSANRIIINCFKSFVRLQKKSQTYSNLPRPMCPNSPITWVIDLIHHKSSKSLFSTGTDSGNDPSFRKSQGMAQVKKVARL